MQIPLGREDKQVPIRTIRRDKTKKTRIDVGWLLDLTTHRSETSHLSGVSFVAIKGDESIHWSTIQYIFSQSVCDEDKIRSRRGNEKVARRMSFGLGAKHEPNISTRLSHDTYLGLSRYNTYLLFEYYSSRCRERKVSIGGPLISYELFLCMKVVLSCYLNCLI